MKYIVSTDKTVDKATQDLEVSVANHQFGVLHVHNLKETMKNKGVEFPYECKILEVCNPHRAKSVLSEDMELNMALPCRISVYEDGKGTKIGMLMPKDLLAMLSEKPALQPIAEEVQAAMIKMIDAAK